MIKQYGNIFQLETKQTTYLFRILQGKYLEHLYYGAKLWMPDDITEEMVEGLCEKTGNGYGHSAVIEEDSSITLDNLCLEFVSSGSGDFRQSPVEIRLADGSYSNRFYYQSAEIYDGIYKNTETTGLPHARVGNHGEITPLEVT